MVFQRRVLTGNSTKVASLLNLFSHRILKAYMVFQMLRTAITNVLSAYMLSTDLKRFMCVNSSSDLSKTAEVLFPLGAPGG